MRFVVFQVKILFEIILKHFGIFKYTFFFNQVFVSGYFLLELETKNTFVEDNTQILFKTMLTSNNKSRK